MDERRTLRVSEAVREELAEIIGFEMDDPRLLAVEVTEVAGQPRRAACHVKVAVRGDGTRAERSPWRPWTTPSIICGTNWPAA